MNGIILPCLQDCGSYWGDSDEDGIPGYFLSKDRADTILKALKDAKKAANNEWFLDSLAVERIEKSIAFFEGDK